jgi:mono/diheme cytochrome c family protein
MKKVVRALGMLAAVAILAAALFVAWAELKSPPDFSRTPLPAIAAVKDPAVIARGRAIAYGAGHCAHCHAPLAEITRHQNSPARGDDLSGGSPIDGGAFGTFYPANLTPDQTGIARLSDGQIARAIRAGILEGGRLGIVMASAAADLSDDDLVAVISYLRSAPPVRREVPRHRQGFLEKALGFLFQPRTSRSPAAAPAASPSIERGRYVAENQALCAGCHTPHHPFQPGRYQAPLFSGNSEPFPGRIDASLEFAPPNLTPDATTGRIAAWSEDQFVDRFRAGRAIADSPMPWECFARLSEDDLRSIYRYLKALPAVRNDRGPSLRKRGWKAGDPT